MRIDRKNGNRLASLMSGVKKRNAVVTTDRSARIGRPLGDYSLPNESLVPSREPAVLEHVSALSYGSQFSESPTTNRTPIGTTWKLTNWTSGLNDTCFDIR